MATEYERPRARIVERERTTYTGSGMGVILGLIVALGLGAILFFAFANRSPTGSSTVTSPPVITAPDQSVPKTSAPPANTTTPTAPSTK